MIVDMYSNILPALHCANTLQTYVHTQKDSYVVHYSDIEVMMHVKMLLFMLKFFNY